MRILFFLLFSSLCLVSCSPSEPAPQPFNGVTVSEIYRDSMSIRAITLIGQDLAFAGAPNYYGVYNAASGTVRSGTMELDTLVTDFRAVAATREDFFMLNAGSPALLYKTGDNGSMELVYREDGKRVFYDAMAFWNDKEGIAMGDPVDDCLSVLITRDGGVTWQKVDCSVLSPVKEGEAAFAASNTNIAIEGDNAWIATGGMASRIFHTADKGLTWEVYDTPVVQGKPTTGMYSLDFYDTLNGFAIGGDYTNPEAMIDNKIRTSDGGKTWTTVASGSKPGYLSCVQYVPDGKGKLLVACGFQGIWHSSDAGDTWTQLSAEPFYTLRFIDADRAYAAGKNRIAVLQFDRTVSERL